MHKQYAHGRSQGTSTAYEDKYKFLRLITNMKVKGHGKVVPVHAMKLCMCNSAHS